MDGCWNQELKQSVVRMRHFNINKSDWRYFVEKEWNAPQSKLPPLWIPEKRLLLRPVSNVCYELIRNGADVDLTLPEAKGNTALHYSCAIGSLSITRWLLEHGANANAVTDKGATPPQCVGSDNRAAIIQALKAHGAQ